MSLPLLCVAALLALSLTPLTAALNITIPAGTVTDLLTVSFPLPLDTLSCLTTNAARTTALATSYGGAIYAFSLASPPPSLAPSYVAGNSATQSGSYWADCAASPAGGAVYLLDTLGSRLYAYNASAAGAAPALVATFVNEPRSSLTALAVDFAAGTAYVASRASSLVYALPLAPANQSVTAFEHGAAARGAVYSLALSADAQTLYYGTQAAAAGQPGYVYAVPASAVSRDLDASTTAAVVAQDSRLTTPDTLLVVGSTMYVKDGGARAGTGNGDGGLAAYTQAIYNLSLPAATASTPAPLRAMYTTTTANLPKGLVLSADGASLVFTTTATVSEYALTQQMKTIFPSSSSSSSSSSSFTSTPTASAASSSSLAVVPVATAAASSSSSGASSATSPASASSSSASPFSPSSSSSAAAVSNKTGASPGLPSSSPASHSLSGGALAAAVVGAALLLLAGW